jgi:rhodanese-related sulfurtransferase
MNYRRRKKPLLPLFFRSPRVFLLAFPGNFLRNPLEFDKKVIPLPEFKSFAKEIRMDVRIVICGMGKVGQAFANLLVQKGKDLQKRYDLTLKAVAAVDIGGAEAALLKDIIRIYGS